MVMENSKVNMKESLSKDEIFHVNKLIACEVIEQRLDIPATPQNIEHLARCITKLESNYMKEMGDVNLD